AAATRAGPPASDRGVSATPTRTPRWPWNEAAASSTDKLPGRGHGAISRSLDLPVVSIFRGHDVSPSPMHRGTTAALRCISLSLITGLELLAAALKTARQNHTPTQCHRPLW